MRTLYRDVDNRLSYDYELGKKSQEERWGTPAIPSPGEDISSYVERARESGEVPTFIVGDQRASGMGIPEVQGYQLTRDLKPYDSSQPGGGISHPYGGRTAVPENMPQQILPDQPNLTDFGDALNYNDPEQFMQEVAQRIGFDPRLINEKEYLYNRLQQRVQQMTPELMQHVFRGKYTDPGQLTEPEEQKHWMDVLKMVFQREAPLVTGELERAKNYMTLAAKSWERTQEQKREAYERMQEAEEKRQEAREVGGVINPNQIIGSLIEISDLNNDDDKMNGYQNLAVLAAKARTGIVMDEERPKIIRFDQIEYPANRLLSIMSEEEIANMIKSQPGTKKVIDEAAPDGTKFQREIIVTPQGLHYYNPSNLYHNWLVNKRNQVLNNRVMVDLNGNIVEDTPKNKGLLAKQILGRMQSSTNSFIYSPGLDLTPDANKAPLPEVPQMNYPNIDSSSPLMGGQFMGEQEGIPYAAGKVEIPQQAQQQTQPAYPKTDWMEKPKEVNQSWANAPVENYKATNITTAIPEQESAQKRKTNVVPVSAEKIGLTPKKAKELGIPIKSGKVDIPVIVPTLPEQAIKKLEEGGRPSAKELETAIEHAKFRIRYSKSPFIEEGGIATPTMRYARPNQYREESLIPGQTSSLYNK